MPKICYNRPMRKQGFTVIELIVLSTFLIVASVVLLLQIQRIGSENTNSQKKVAINAIYYSLEESFYPNNKYYPEFIDKDTLKTMDPSLLIDPSGAALGESNSSYRYDPTNCSDGKAKSFLSQTIRFDENLFDN